MVWGGTGSGERLRITIIRINSIRLVGMVFLVQVECLVDVVNLARLLFGELVCVGLDVSVIETLYMRGLAHTFGSLNGVLLELV